MRRNWFRNRLGRKSSRAQRGRSLWKPRPIARSFSGFLERLEDRRLLTVLNIFGDQDFVGENDTFLIKRNSGDPSKVDVFLNSSLVAQQTLASVTQINIFGLAGNDNLTVDSSNGLISVVDGINFDGGTGFDYLNLQQTGGPTITSDHLAIGATAGSGISTIVGGATQTVYFQNIEPIFDFVPSVNLVIERSGFFPSSILDGNNAINYSTGFAPGVGRVTIDNFEPILFGTKDHLVIDAGAGDDVINLNNPNVPTGNTFSTLQDITIIGNDPTASDKLIVNGTSGFDTINYSPSATIGAGSVQVNALPTVFFTTIESLVIDGKGGNDALTYTSPVNAGLGNVLTFTPGNAGDSATVSGRQFGGSDLVPMTFQNVGIGATLTFATADTGPFDYLDFFGTAAPDQFELNPFSGGTINVTRFGQPSLSTTIEVHAGSVSTLALHGLEGDDLFNLVGPLFYSRLVIDGGGPSASDVVNISGAVGPVTVNLADSTLGTITSITGYGGLITLIGDEVVNLDLNGETLTVIGTAQPDAITYTPTGILAGTFTLAGLNTVFNFTDISDGGGAFVIDPMGGADTVTVNGTSSGDSINVSRSGANTEVQVNGLQAVTLVTANTENLVINAGAGDDGLTVDASGGPILIPIVYDGGTGRDSLSLTGGTAVIDTYTPGPIPGSGNSTIVFTGPSVGVQVVNFLNLEPVYDDVAATTLTINGTDANNAINYTSGGFNDHGGGLVTVDDQEGYYFANKTHLIINAGAGDDVINLNNPSTPPGLMDITVNGDDPTASDTLIVNASTNAGTITYAPTGPDNGSITGAQPVPVFFTTTENVTINGQALDNNLTVQTITFFDQHTLTPGTAIDSGTITTTTNLIPSSYPTLKFVNLGSGGSLTFTDASAGRLDALIYNGTSASDTFDVSSSGVVTLNSQIAVNTPGVFRLILQGLDGDDTFNIAGNHPFTSLRIDGGNPSASDVLNFTGSGTTANLITADYGAATVTEATFGPVSFTGVEILNVNASGHNFTLNGTAGDDAISVTPTGADAVTAQLISSAPDVGATPVVNASNVGTTYTISGAGGEDRLFFYGTTASDTINISRDAAAPTLEVVSRQIVTVTFDFLSWIIDGVDSGGITGDTFNVNDSGSIFAAQLIIHASSRVGDVLNLNTGFNQTYTPGSTNDSGEFSTLGTSVSFTGIETANVTYASSATIATVNAGSGANQITVVGTAANQVSTTVDNNTLVTWTGLTTLNVNAGSGDDVISVTPGLFTGAGGINIDGGDPTASDKLIVNGTSGNDAINYTASATIGSGTVQVNALSLVTFTTTESLVIDGQGGTDDLTVTTPSGGDLITYTPGAAPDAGTIAIRGQSGGTARVPLTFQHIGALGSVTFANSGGGRVDALELDGTNNSDIFNVVGSADTIQERQSNGLIFTTVVLHTGGINFVTLRGLEGDDTFNIGGTLPYGLDVDGGDPSASDTVNLSGATVAVTVNLADSTAPTNTSITGYGTTVTLIGVEIANLLATGNTVLVKGTTHADSITATPTGSATATVTAAGLNTTFNFSNVSTAGGGFAIDGNGGSDQLTVRGTQGADSIDVNTAIANAVKVNALLVINYNSNLAHLEIFALAGNDTIDVTPSVNTTIFVDGGDPIGNTPGDTIKLHPTAFFAVEPGPENDEGGFRNLGRQRISWDHIERVIIVGGGNPGLILGTNGNDIITIIARDSSYDAAADGVQDFTVSVNDGNDILFIDTANLFVDALAGNDQIHVREPAPNNAVWNTQIFVAGGTPAALAGNVGDIIVLETPGSQSVIYTPNPAAGDIPVVAGVTFPTPSPIDTAQFNDTTNTSKITATQFTITGFYQSSPGGVEQFVYQGYGGNDTLTYRTPANGGAGTLINYTPGATQDAGTITARMFGGDTLVPLIFQGLGFTGGINFTSADSGRPDRLVVAGTASGDIFDVNGAGAGTVRERRNTVGNVFTTVTLTTTSIGTLELDGLGGVDVFNLVGGLPYTNTVVEANDPIMNLSGATGPVTVNLGDNTLANPYSTVTGYGGTVTLIGIDHANLDLTTQSLTVNGTVGDDTIDFTPSSATAGSFKATTTGPVVATSPQFTYSNLATGITVNGGSGFDLLGLIATAGNDVINAVQSSATALSYTQNAFTIAFTFSSLDGANIFALAGDDLIRISVTDALETTTPAASLRFSVDGGPPNASDRLIINDDGIGDLTILRQGADSRSGSATIGAFNPIVYKNIERVDITPVDPITGGTGTDGKGRIKVFHNDPFEYNDTRLNSAQLQRVGASPTSPTIDPGGLTQPFSVPGDEDWYEFRPQGTGTFQVKILFDLLPTLSNGRAGLPGSGDLLLDIYDANGVLITSGVVAPGGKAAVFAATNDPAFPQFNRIFVRVRGATLPSINVYDFDNIAGLITGNPGVSNVDNEGPQVTDVTVNNLTTAQYNLFSEKAANAEQGPTPLVYSLTVHFRDLPPRAPGFLYPALDYMLTADQARGLFQVKGDANGIVAIDHVIITNPFPGSVGQIPESSIEIVFAQPLPDDRFTLIISDSLRDPPLNKMDGESNAAEPNGAPFFPSGDGHSGGNFVARFTVDTRPELGAFAANRVYIDANGNFVYDPQNPDFTNRDLTFTLQISPTLLGIVSQMGVHDSVFAGNFQNQIRGTANGFAKLAAYGNDSLIKSFRWLIDTDGDGVIDPTLGDIFTIQSTGFTMFDQNGAAVTFNPSGIAIAGNFDGDTSNGDEIGLFDGTHFYLDTNHNYVIDSGDEVITTALRGFPIVGDFDGDGIPDLATWKNDVFYFNFGYQPGGAGTQVFFTGTIDATINFGFPGVGEVPLAADMDQDGITDIGLWVPGRAGTVPAGSAEEFFLLSNNLPSTLGGPPPRPIIPGSVYLLDHPFAPTPLGGDLYANLFDEFATPIVGNFDPPVTPKSSSPAATVADSSAPTSSVAALPATQSSASFTVRWTGSDNTGGSGIAGYDIYVSDNNGQFTRWLKGTTNTSATFTGVNGHSYKFISVATDNAGNVQATPAAAQATTSIQIRALTTTLLAASSTSIVPGQSVTFTATVKAVDSGNPTPTGTVTFKDGTLVLSTVALVGGVAKYTNTNLAAGNHNITATYNPIAPNIGSVSATLVERVVNAALQPDPLNPGAMALYVGGTAGNDIITILPANAAGAVTVLISNASTNNRATSLGTFVPTGRILVYGMAGNDTLQLSTATIAGKVVSVSQPISFFGGDGIDTLVGPNLANTWNITGANSGTLNGNTFEGIENLTGGASTDVFLMNTGGSLSGKINGAAGANKLDYSGYAPASIVNLQTNTATATGGLAGIQSLVGGSATTLIGPNLAVTWNITGANAGNVNGLSFTGVSNLTGGSQADTFAFSNGAGVSGKIDGGAGADILRYSLYTSPVTVNLATASATGAGSIANMEGMIGGTSASDSLIGPNQNSTWSISSANAGKVNTFTFSSVENLTGGALNDNFVLARGVGVAGRIDGGAGINMLDYAAYTTSVNVNLAAGTATNVGGGVNNLRVVRGGSAADTIIGDDSGNALIGGAGNDTLIAGNGRNLLFGGLGADTMTGGAGQSILFSGTTNFDSNVTSIDNLLTYWARTDLDYAVRVAALKAGTAAGVPKLSSTTVINDTSVNTLNGGSGLDWFFAKLGSPKDIINNLDSGEQIN